VARRGEVRGADGLRVGASRADKAQATMAYQFRGGGVERCTDDQLRARAHGSGTWYPRPLAWPFLAAGLSVRGGLIETINTGNI